MRAQVADARVPLGSVSHMCKVGNKVILEQGKSRLVSPDGSIVPLRENNGSYELDLWVPVNKDPSKNAFEVKEEPDEGEVMSEEVTMGFIRQGLFP